MESSVFKVKYTEFSKSTKKGSESTRGSEESTNVMADNAEEAIAKLRKNRVGSSFVWEDDDSKKYRDTVTRINVLGVEHVCYIHI